MSSFNLIGLHMTKGNVKPPYMLNICSQFYRGRKSIPRTHKLLCKVTLDPKNMNCEVQNKKSEDHYQENQEEMHAPRETSKLIAYLSGRMYNLSNHAMLCQTIR